MNKKQRRIWNLIICLLPIACASLLCIALHHPACHDYVGSSSETYKKFVCLALLVQQELEFYASQTSPATTSVWSLRLIDLTLVCYGIMGYEPTMEGCRFSGSSEKCGRPGSAQPIQPPQPSMDGSQLVQWWSVQTSNMAGDLQHNVRALMVKASSPMPVSDGHDEVSSLRKYCAIKLIESCRPCYRTRLWRLRLSRVNGRWQVKKHMHV